MRENEYFLLGEEKALRESERIKQFDECEFFQEVVFKNIQPCADGLMDIKGYAYLRKALDLRQDQTTSKLSEFFSELKNYLKPRPLLFDEFYRLKTLASLYLKCFDKESRKFNEALHREIFDLTFNKQKLFENFLASAPSFKTAMPLAIIGSARSGSSLLGSYLRSMEQVFYLNEILNYKAKKGLPLSKWSREQAKAHILKCYQSFDKKFVAAKFLDHQLAAARIELKDIVRDIDGVKFLFIYRKDLLAQFVSEKIARQTKQYLWGGEVFQGQIELNLSEFKDFCKSKKDFYDKVLSSNLLSKENHIVIEYEKFAEAPEKIFRERVFPLMEIEAEPVSSEMIKQNQKPLPRLIVGYEKLKDELQKDYTKLEYPL